ncbi:MAG: cation:proton antiporter [Actinomycetota bacterium]
MVIESPLTALAVIVGLGITAQWIAWRFDLPAILLLLAGGIMLGPVTGALSPDRVFGDALLPFVSVAVAIILFEGGLTLDLRDLGAHGRAVTLLVTVGAVVTWATATLAARFFLFENWSLSFLIGAIVVVSGPTVIIPLLRQVRPNKQTSTVLRWEAILIDPIGAIMAVLVYEVILAEGGTLGQIVFSNLLNAFFIGGVVGGVGAIAMIQLLKRYLLPDFLHVAVTLAIVIGAFAGSNALHEESGLLAVTVMGVVLASQRSVHVRHILEFEENLRTLLLSGLFIVLGARLGLDDLRQAATLPVLGFLAVLIFIARPLAVVVSTWRSTLSKKERVFLSWVAPRGIVAAAVASLFAFKLADHFEPLSGGEGTIFLSGAGRLVPTTFAVILGTIAIYSTTAKPLASKLGITSKTASGVLIVGGNEFTRDLALVLQDQDVRVVLADTAWDAVTKARQRGVKETFYGSVLSDSAMSELDLTGMGILLALTQNDEVNALATQHFVHMFDRKGVFQVSPRSGHHRQQLASHMRGRVFAADDATLVELTARLAAGHKIKVKKLTEASPYQSLVEEYGDTMLPLLIIEPDDEVLPFAADETPATPPGARLVALMPAPTPVEKAIAKQSEKKKRDDELQDASQGETQSADSPTG